jgi:hydroxyacylglutathione hydrolase
VQGIAKLAAPIPVVRITGREFPSNSYLVATGTAGGCLLIDPGLDAELITEALTRHQFVPQAILCTHGHFDHLGSAAGFQQEFGAPVYLPEADLPIAKSSNFLLMAMKMRHRITVPQVDHLVRGESVFVVGDIELRYRPTPGHTPGSCVITLGGIAFTGDTLYSHGVGLSGLPGENSAQLKASITGLLDALADDVLVMPGHGGEAVLGDIRRANLPLQAFLGRRALAQQDD